MTIDNHEALESFIAVMLTCFRRPNENEDAVEALRGMFREHLVEFDAATLEFAERHIAVTHTDPFMPTIGRCVEVCAATKASKQALADLLDPPASRRRAERYRQSKTTASKGNMNP